LIDISEYTLRACVISTAVSVVWSFH